MERNELIKTRQHTSDFDTELTVVKVVTEKYKESCTCHSSKTYEYLPTPIDKYVIIILIYRKLVDEVYKSFVLSSLFFNIEKDLKLDIFALRYSQ